MQEYYVSVRNKVQNFIKLLISEQSKEPSYHNDLIEAHYIDQQYPSYETRAALNAYRRTLDALQEAHEDLITAYYHAESLLNPKVSQLEKEAEEEYERFLKEEEEEEDE